MEAFEEELDRRGDDRRLLGAVGDVEGTEIADRVAQARDLAHPRDVLARRRPIAGLDGEPVLERLDDLLELVERDAALNVAWSAFVISRSTIRSSGDSSPAVSSSTLPTVDATTAPRSETRGAATRLAEADRALERRRLEHLGVRHRDPDADTPSAG